MPKVVASQEDWIKIGFELFAESGEAGLNVDKMSRLLKCNKSSFYWHFKAKEEFIHCMIDHWVKSDTKQIIELVNEEEAAGDRLVKLIKIVFRKDNNLDFFFYLKKYAQRREDVSRLLDGIDAERIAFVKDLLSGMGYSEQDASIKAKLFYKVLIGYHEMIRYKEPDDENLSEVFGELGQFIELPKRK
jgi:AcrR family transcriptional regulator